MSGDAGKSTLRAHSDCTTRSDACEYQQHIEHVGYRWPHLSPERPSFLIIQARTILHVLQSIEQVRLMLGVNGLT